MEQEKHITNLYKLSDTFKISIPEKVEKIIRHLCNRIHDVEWSGILFYKTEGSWDKGDLNIICEDILPMDIGTSTYTEFDMSPDVVSYMTEYGLLDCECGLIHSHNNMATFFSGTDTNTLLKEGTDRNHFVSLIVNNVGEYTAAITRKMEVQETALMKMKYNTFNDEEIPVDLKCERKYTRIEYAMLDVDKEEANNDLNSIDERLDEIKKSKEANRKKTLNHPSLFNEVPFGMNWDDYVWPKKDIRSSSKNDSIFPEKFIKLTAARLLTGTMLITDISKFDFEDWVNKMDNLYDKAFADIMDGEVALEYFMEMLCEYVIYTAIPEEICNKTGKSAEELGEKLIPEVAEFLDTLPKSIYKDAIINHLFEMTV